LETIFKLTTTYKEICKNIAENQSGDDKWIERWDDSAQVPFMYKGKNWVSYENEKSIAIKVRHKYL
jgi:GH18 family chitinase